MTCPRVSWTGPHERGRSVCSLEGSGHPECGLVHLKHRLFFGQVVLVALPERDHLAHDLGVVAAPLGLGHHLFLVDDLGQKRIQLSGQTYLEAFYKSFGFQPISDMYLEDDIPHKDMLLVMED